VTVLRAINGFAQSLPQRINFRWRLQQAKRFQRAIGSSTNNVWIKAQVEVEQDLRVFVDINPINQRDNKLLLLPIKALKYWF